MSREITKQETREAILDAAERLLARYGYGKMTMSDLAEEAGIGVGTTYLHFPGKAEVALAVVDRANQRVVTQLQAMAHSQVSLPGRLREMLVMRILLRFEAARHRSHQMEELRTAIRQQKAVQQHRTRWFDREADILASVLHEGQELGILEFTGARRTAETLLWAMDSLMPRNLKVQDFDDPETFRDKTRRVADLLMLSLRPLDREADILASVLHEGQELGILEFTGARRTAETLLWAMDSLMPRNLKVQDFDDPETFRDKTRRVADLLMLSLRPLDNPRSFDV